MQYHYKTKEALIRVILEEMFRDYDSMYESVQPLFSTQTLRKVLRHGFGFAWKYHFFYREKTVALAAALALFANLLEAVGIALGALMTVTTAITCSHASEITVFMTSVN